jgi:hypothetical protein
VAGTGVAAGTADAVAAAGVARAIRVGGTAGTGVAIGAVTTVCAIGVAGTVGPDATVAPDGAARAAPARGVAGAARAIPTPPALARAGTAARDSEVPALVDGAPARLPVRPVRSAPGEAVRRSVPAGRGSRVTGGADALAAGDDGAGALPVTWAVAGRRCGVLPDEVAPVCLGGLPSGGGVAAPRLSDRLRGSGAASGRAVARAEEPVSPRRAVAEAAFPPGAGSVTGRVTALGAEGRAVVPVLPCAAVAACRSRGRGAGRTTVDPVDVPWMSSAAAAAHLAAEAASAPRGADAASAVASPAGGQADGVAAPVAAGSAASSRPASRVAKTEASPDSAAGAAKGAAGT